MSQFKVGDVVRAKGSQDIGIIRSVPGLSLYEVLWTPECGRSLFWSEESLELTASKTRTDSKQAPLATGVLDFFPDALTEVAKVSLVGNKQHAIGEALHFDRNVSKGDADALLGHLRDRGTVDSDGIRHSAKVAWRALAMLQRELEGENK